MTVQMQQLLKIITALMLAEVSFADQDPNRDQGYAENIFLDVKFECSNADKKLYSVASEIQCHHRCLRNEQCALLNFKHASGENGNIENCEIFGLSKHDSSCQSVEGMTGWKAVIFKRLNVTLPPPAEPVYEDCKDAYQKNMAAVSGVYNLKDGKHHCVMENLQGCGEGGWTLALKMNGSMGTFEFSSLLWKNNKTYNTENGLKSFLSFEAKFPAFNLLRLEKLCMGMYRNNSMKWIGLNLNETSLTVNVTLQEIFKNETYVSTALGRSNWKGFVTGSSLQSYCNREGFNVKGDGNELKIRIGIAANQEANCLTPESYIGFGSTMVSLCNPAIIPISCGNFAACFADNGDKSYPAMGFLLIK